jgi:hypothetical protein
MSEVHPSPTGLGEERPSHRREFVTPATRNTRAEVGAPVATHGADA